MWLLLCPSLESEYCGGGYPDTGYRLTPPVVGYAGLARPWRAILFWKAVGEMIWAEDMLAILCRALSLATWSYGEGRRARVRRTDSLREARANSSDSIYVGFPTLPVKLAEP